LVNKIKRFKRLSAYVNILTVQPSGQCGEYLGDVTKLWQLFSFNFQ
jgi:hypothetical protein